MCITSLAALYNWHVPILIKQVQHYWELINVRQIRDRLNDLWMHQLMLTNYTLYLFKFKSNLDGPQTWMNVWNATIQYLLLIRYCKLSLSEWLFKTVCQNMSNTTQSCQHPLKNCNAVTVQYMLCWLKCEFCWVLNSHKSHSLLRVIWRNKKNVVFSI